MTNSFPNRYPGNCANCGARVAANAGTCCKLDGEFKVFHAAGQCVDQDASPAPTGTPVAEVGMYRTPDDTWYKVQESKAHRLYAKVVRHYGERIEFEYAPGAIHDLTAEMKVTAEQATEFGMLYGTCCWCGTTVGEGADKRSVVMGYGPVCAKHNGWPFPTVAEFRRQHPELVA